MTYLNMRLGANAADVVVVHEHGQVTEILARSQLGQHHTELTCDILHCPSTNHVYHTIQTTLSSYERIGFVPQNTK